MQILIVALLVAACAGYAVWTLMPAALKRPVASALLGVGMPLPARLRRTLEAAVTRSAGGCGCDGCDHAAKPAPAAQPVTFHRRPGR